MTADDTTSAEVEKEKCSKAERPENINRIGKQRELPVASSLGQVKKESTSLAPSQPQSVATKATLKNYLADPVKRNNMELQFWGYEVGNILATIAGAGGFLTFFNTIDTVFGNARGGIVKAIFHLLIRYPDATVTIGLGVLVLIVPVLRVHVFSKWSYRWLNTIDLTVTIVAVAILCYAIMLDSSWIAIASSCFVLASCFLRQCRQNPLLIKAGGMALVCGGAGLALYGLQLAMPLAFDKDNIVIFLGVLTLITGIYVVFAGLLTYEGGIFATRDFITRDGEQSDDIWLVKLAHPVNGFLARCIFSHTDKPVLSMNYRISRPAIFWVSDSVKNNQPFKTSMLARLPWRVLTGLAALISQTPAGFAFFTANVCWAIGDLAIGSEDW